jgi:hypothetical protein
VCVQREFFNSITTGAFVSNYRVSFLILPVVLCWGETWSLTLREDHRPRVFEKGAEDNIWN